MNLCSAEDERTSKPMTVLLPVRFTSKDGTGHEYAALDLLPEKSALLLVDCDGDCGEACNQVINDHIAPALQAARAVGIKGVYVYGDGRLPDGANSRASEYHHTRRGRRPHKASWRPRSPVWTASIEPRSDEPLIGKMAQNAFVGTTLYIYLRSHDINTLLTGGFSFKSCLFYTINGAFERNHRIVFLRDGTDPVGTNEFADTLDSTLPAGGWVRTVLTRLIEDHLGYTSTCEELIRSCEDSRKASQAVG